MLVRTVVAFLLATAVVGQDRGLASLPVGDLVEGHRLTEPYLAPPLLRGSRSIDRERDWCIASDYERIPEQRQAAWFTDDQLRETLRRLMGRGEPAMAVIGSRLLIAKGLEPVARTTLHELRQRLPVTIDMGILVRRSRDGQDEVLLQRRVPAVSGRTSRWSAVDGRWALLRHEVEIAQASSIANPVVDQAAAGAMVLLRPQLLPDGDELWAEVLVRVIDRVDVPAMELGDAGLGALDRAEQRIGEFATVLRCGLQKEPVVREWSGPDGAQYRLELTPRWHPPVPVRPGGHEVEFVPPLLSTTGFRTAAWLDPDRFGEDGDEEEPADGGIGQFRELLDFDMEPLAEMESGGLVVMGQGAALLRAAVQSWYDDLGPSVAVEVTVHEVAPGGGPDDPAARRVGRVRCELVPGGATCATSYRERSAVIDWDCEVAQSSRIPVPLIHRVQDGLFVNLRWTDNRLELDGEVVVAGEDRVRSVSLDQVRGGMMFGTGYAPKDGGSMSMEVEPPASLPQDVVNLEQPARKRLPFAANLKLGAEAPATFRQRAEALGVGRELLFVVRRVDE